MELPFSSLKKHHEDPVLRVLRYNQVNHAAAFCGIASLPIGTPTGIALPPAQAGGSMTAQPPRHASAAERWQGTTLYGVNHSPWVEGVRLAMVHHGIQPRLTSHPHRLGWVWKNGLIFPALRAPDGSIWVDSFQIYARLEAAGHALGVETVPAPERVALQARLERLFLSYAPGRCIRGRRWRFIVAWSQIPERPYTRQGVISRALVSIYFFVLIRLGIRLSEARKRPVYDLDRIEAQLAWWDRRLAAQPWLTGNAPGFLDFALLGQVQCMCSGLTDELLPVLRRQAHLVDWLKRITGHLRDAPHIHARRVLDDSASVELAGRREQWLFWLTWLLALLAWPVTGVALLVLLARRQRSASHSGAVLSRQARTDPRR